MIDWLTGDDEGTGHRFLYFRLSALYSGKEHLEGKGKSAVGQSIGPLVRWPIGLLFRWSVRPLFCCFVGQLGSFSVGPLVCWSIDISNV